MPSTIYKYLLKLLLFSEKHYMYQKFIHLLEKYFFYYVCFYYVLDSTLAPTTYQISSRNIIIVKHQYIDKL